MPWASTGCWSASGASFTKDAVVSSAGPDRGWRRARFVLATAAAEDRFFFAASDRSFGFAVFRGFAPTARDARPFAGAAFFRPLDAIVRFLLISRFAAS
jgi:hypothetical protein